MANFRHGWFGSPTYRSWESMKARCMNSNHTWFKRYGGRGIRVCARWMDFVNFLEDMGRRPSMLHTIERLDNDGNYEQRNCTWSTRRRQANNRSSNHCLTHGGETLTISEWSRRVGIKKVTLGARIKRGWDAEKALGTPV